MTKTKTKTKTMTGKIRYKISPLDRKNKLHAPSFNNFSNTLFKIAWLETLWLAFSKLKTKVFTPNLQLHNLFNYKL